MINTLTSIQNLTNSNTGFYTQSARLTKDEFLRILITELTHQNPLEPLDSSDFLSQLVELHNLEATSLISDSMVQFQKFIQLSTASNLIGKYAKAVSDYGNTVEGIVEKVILEDDKVRLIIYGEPVELDNIKEVKIILS